MYGIVTKLLQTVLEYLTYLILFPATCYTLALEQSGRMEGERSVFFMGSRNAVSLTIQHCVVECLISPPFLLFLSGKNYHDIEVLGSVGHNHHSTNFNSYSFSLLISPSLSLPPIFFDILLSLFFLFDLFHPPVSSNLNQHVLWTTRMVAGLVELT